MNLLDTHTIIWFINGDEQLSQKAINSIEQDGAKNYISIASLWEIAIKVSIGKLELKTPFYHISEKIRENGFQILSLNFDDTVLISALPFYHRDPFDRIIIAQSINNNLSLISRDKHFENYDIDLVW